MHSHSASGWIILERLLYEHANHFGGDNEDVQTELLNLQFTNGESLDSFHQRATLLQQEIILSKEIVPLTRLLNQYLLAPTKSLDMRPFVAAKLGSLLAFIRKNGKNAAYHADTIALLYDEPITVQAQKILTIDPAANETSGAPNDSALEPAIVSLTASHNTANSLSLS